MEARAELDTLLLPIDDDGDHHGGGGGGDAHGAEGYSVDVEGGILQLFDESTGQPKIVLTETHHGIKNLEVYPDLSVSRPPMELVAANPDFVNGVASKDVLIDGKTNMWARIFLPDIIDGAYRCGQERRRKRKLPIVLYFHGGGFICLSVDTRMLHEFCEKISKVCEAIVVSVQYRLAPEHRLPSQYEDGSASLEWLESQALEALHETHSRRGPEQDHSHEFPPSAEPWLSSGDFSRVFLMGDSAGGNIVHHLAVEASSRAVMSPLQLCGQILIQPAFGGQVRTPAELLHAGARDVNPTGLNFSDMFWKLALPKDADRNHPCCHVFPQLAHLCEREDFSLPETLVVVGGQDPLRDWDVMYFETLQKSRTVSRLVNYDEACHGFYVRHNNWTEILLQELDRVINSPSGPSINNCAA